jgi:hypothetical protein
MAWIARLVAGAFGGRRKDGPIAPEPFPGPSSPGQALSAEKFAEDVIAWEELTANVVEDEFNEVAGEHCIRTYKDACRITIESFFFFLTFMLFSCNAISQRAECWISPKLKKYHQPCRPPQQR